MFGTIFVAAMSCSTPEWKTQPVFEGTELVGTMTSFCEFGAKSGGDFEALYENEKALWEKGADTIHEGPTPITEGTLDGASYDLTETATRDGVTLTIRMLATLLRDENVFIERSQSKSVTATGFAKNIRALSGSVHLFRRGDDAYAAEFTSTMRVNRPAPVPKAKLVEIVTEQAKKEMQSTAKETITQFQEVL